MTQALGDSERSTFSHGNSVAEEQLVSDVSALTGRGDAGRLCLPVRHGFTLEVKVDQQFVGPVPGGYRVDLYYSGERSDDPKSAPLRTPACTRLKKDLQRHLKQGRILSGNDWVTIDSETSFDFDSRITIELGAKGKSSCPVAARLRGRACLRQVLRKDKKAYFKDTTPAVDVLATWRSGFDEDSYLPLVLSALFDVPLNGVESSHQAIYDDARPLAHALFIGRGKAIFRRAEYAPLKSIVLDLYAVEDGNTVQYKEECAKT